MSFVFPLFLLALTAVSIPVIIHLYNWRKYKQLKFPDTSFLESLITETKKYARIKNWKLLLLRIALLTTLVLGFAQPYFSRNSQADTSVSIYIDNSWSMSYADGQKSLLQQSKEQALELLRKIPAGQPVRMISNNSRSGYTTRSEAGQWISSLQYTFAAPSLPAIAGSLISPEDKGRTEIYMFSDFQQHTAVPDSIQQSIGNPHAYLYLIPVATGKTRPNIYIDTAYFLQPSIDLQQNNPLVVKIANAGGGIQTQLQVQQQGKPSSFSAIHTEESTYTDTIDLRFNNQEWQSVTLAVNDHPVSFDDTFRISFRNRQSQHIAVFHSGRLNNYLWSALQSFNKYTIAGYDIREAGSADIKNAGLIILQDVREVSRDLVRQLATWWDQGKHIVFIPGEQLDIPQFNALMEPATHIRAEGWDTSKQGVYSISYNHPLYSNVFEKISENVSLPVTHKRLLVTAGLRSNPQYLMTFRDGKPFISVHKMGNGQLTFLAAPVNTAFNNFPTTEYFAPLLYNLAQSSGGQSFYTFGPDNTGNILLPNSEKTTWKIRNKLHEELIPAQRPMGNVVRIMLDNSIEQPGYYQLYNDLQADTFMIALNHHTRESVLRYADPLALRAWFTHPEHIRSVAASDALYSNAQEADFPLWKALLIIAALLLVAETIVAVRNKP